MRSALIPAFVYTCIAVLVMWPSIHDWGVLVPGADGTRVWESYWLLQHVLQSVVDSQSLFVTQDLNFPFGGRVVAPDIFGAVLVLPITYVWGPAVSMSVLVVFQLVFSGLVMHLFMADFLKRGLEVEVPRWGPWLSGAALSVSSLMMSHIHNGSTEALSVGWTVLAIWMAWRASQQFSIRNAIVAFCCLCLASLAHVYGGLVAFVFAAALSVSRTHGRFSWSSYGIFSVLSIVLALPIVFLLVQGTDNTVDLLNPAGVEQVQQITRSTGSADPLTYVRPGRHLSPDVETADLSGRRSVHVHYLGLSGIALTVWLLCTGYRREYGFVLLGGFICLLLSLGPVWVMDGRPVLLSGDLAVPMPFFLLESLPGFSWLESPWRFALGPTITLAMMVGLAVDQRRLYVAVGALIVLVLDAQLLSPIAERSRTTDVEVSSTIVALASAPDGAVMNYPLTATNAYLLEQTVHGKPIVGAFRDVSNPRADRLWRRIRQTSTRKPDTFHSAVSSTAKRLGIRYLVIHTDPNAEPDVYTAAVRKIETLFPAPEWGQGQTRVVSLW